MDKQLVQGLGIWTAVIVGGIIFWVYVVRVLWGFRPQAGTPW